jgi:hypothetical protein
VANSVLVDIVECFTHLLKVISADRLTERPTLGNKVEELSPLSEFEDEIYDLSLGAVFLGVYAVRLAVNEVDEVGVVDFLHHAHLVLHHFDEVGVVLGCVSLEDFSSIGLIGLWVYYELNFGVRSFAQSFDNLEFS